MKRQEDRVAAVIRFNVYVADPDFGPSELLPGTAGTAEEREERENSLIKCLVWLNAY